MLLLMFVASALIVCLLYLGLSIIFDEHPSKLQKIFLWTLTTFAILAIIGLVLSTQLAIQAITFH